MCDVIHSRSFSKELAAINKVNLCVVNVVDETFFLNNYCTFYCE